VFGVAGVAVLLRVIVQELVGGSICLRKISQAPKFRGGMVDQEREESAKARGKQSDPGGVLSISEFGTFGFQFAASIVAFLFLGQWLDHKLGTSPWLLIAGVFIGAGASFYSMYRKLMRAPKQ